MSKFSWFTSTERDDGGWYKCNARVELISNTLSFTDYPFYKPNRKGGHTHFHSFNASVRKNDRRKIKLKYKKALLVAEFTNIMFQCLGLDPLYDLDPKIINRINQIKKGGRTWLAVARNPAARNRRKSSIRLDARRAHG